jgi:peptidoglycan/LPS O-acetylase OafA/YrhL
VPPADNKSRIWAFDVLRLLAMACVALRHLMSITSYDIVPLPRYLGLGIFSALSGYLALRSLPVDNRRWLRERLLRLYLPYWLVLVCMFLMNWVVQYKPVTWQLMLSQFAGTTYFTHPGQQVGIHTWFVSLLLLNSILTVILRSHAVLLPLFFLATYTCLPLESPFVDCMLAFMAGAMIARFGENSLGAALVGTLCGLLAVRLHPGFWYASFGSFALCLALALSRVSLPRLTRCGNATYEFYLVHGPIYLACVSILGLSFQETLWLGTAAALVSAWSLRMILPLLRQTAARFFLRPVATVTA